MTFLICTISVLTRNATALTPAAIELFATLWLSFLPSNGTLLN